MLLNTNRNCVFDCFIDRYGWLFFGREDSQPEKVHLLEEALMFVYFHGQNDC